MFSINCLEITANKAQWRKNRSLYKNLLARKDYRKYKKDMGTIKGFHKRFFFNDFYKHNQYGSLETNTIRAIPKNFFGDNINVQAIVGQNGSGKSTLMDLMYMAINNFSYLFDRGNERPGAGDLLFTKSLYLKLYFSLDNNEHILLCNGEKIKLDELLLEIDKNPNGYTDKDEKYKGIPDDDLPNKLKNFFYTIVSNYSMQSFISSNYICDAYIHHKKDDNNQYDFEIKDCWIDSIFHKNDGYKKSIVLNPYRNYGKIDMETELGLSKDRFITLVVKDKNIDETYTLEKITYKISEEKKEILTKSFAQLIPLDCFRNDPYVLEELAKPDNSSTIEGLERSAQILRKVNAKDLTFFNDYLKNKIHLDERFKCLTTNYSLNILQNSPDEKKICLLYLYKKICQIVLRYSEYKEYKTFSPFNKDGSIEKTEATPLSEEKTKELLDKILSGKSHIELKARRAIEFLKLSDNQIQSLCANPSIEIDTYLKSWWPNPHEKDLDNILEHLPPSIFDKEITLKNKTNNSIVDYKQLSSGEHQKYQTISTHLYHLANLISVQESNKTSEKKRLAYKYVNLVFDEIEICFHPEYQRKMVNTLLQMLTARKMNINCTINIFIVTHSPFILSDIPASNVLFLEEGTQNVSKNKKTLTFAQNIGEMMYDSFFMKKTIGDFAETKLKELIKWKQGKASKIRTNEEAKRILDLIGDPVIRSLIEEIEKIEVSDD